LTRAGNSILSYSFFLVVRGFGVFTASPLSAAAGSALARVARVRARFAAAAAAERTELARALASAGARHVVLTTAGDWLRSFAVFLRRGARR